MATSRPNGDDLRRVILDCTRRLLVSEGYTGLSMRKIAAAVGCSATSIYLHFENKDALTHDLIDEGMQRLHERLAEAVDAYDEPANQLDAMGRAYVTFGRRNPEYYQVMFQLHPERMSRYPVPYYRRARRNLDLFGEVMERGVEAGQLHAEPTPEVAAHVLWTALHGLVSLLLAERIDVKVADEAFVEAAVEHALASYRVTVQTS